MSQTPHYQFAHRDLPQAFLEQPDEFRSSLQQGDHAVTSLFSESELKVERFFIGEWGDLLVVEMPPPQNAAEAYMVALTLAGAPRYFTIERTSDDDPAPSRLGEWSLQTRTGHGGGPEVSVGNFAMAVKGLLDSGASGLSVGQDDLNVTPEEARSVGGGEPVSMNANKFVACHVALLVAVEKKHIWTALGLRWWHFKQRKIAGVVYPILGLLLLGCEMLRTFPEEEERISYAVTTVGYCVFGRPVVADGGPDNFFEELVEKVSALGRPGCEPGARRLLAEHRALFRRSFRNLTLL